MNTAIRLKIMEHGFRGGLWHQSGNTPTQKLNFQTGSNTLINVFILATLPTFSDAPKEMKATPKTSRCIYLTMSWNNFLDVGKNIMNNEL